MFGDKDRSKGDNAMLQHTFPTRENKVSALLWFFDFVSGLIKKTSKKVGNWLLKKL